MQKKTELSWNSREKKLLLALNSPAKIQDYVDSLKYNTDGIVRSLRYVIKSRKAHCFDGAIFAAGVLDFHGIPSSLLALYANGHDDDHVLAVFRRNGLFGAIAKSNYVPIRWRDPVYKSLRELVMSYFDGYFTLAGDKTLRAYSKPFALNKVRDIDWRFSAADLDPIGSRIDLGGRTRLLPQGIGEKQINLLLRKADPRSVKGAAVGLDLKGIY